MPFRAIPVGIFLAILPAVLPKYGPLVSLSRKETESGMLVGGLDKTRYASENVVLGHKDSSPSQASPEKQESGKNRRICRKARQLTVLPLNNLPY